MTYQAFLVGHLFYGGNFMKKQNKPNILTHLFEEDDKLYIYLRNPIIGKAFMQIAEDEGFLFSDGKKPTKRKSGDIMAIYKNKEICYVGYTGHIAFRSQNCNIKKIDFEKLLNHSKDYIIA